MLLKCKLRHGHRALRHDASGLRKTKLKTMHHIELNREKPCHDDELVARDYILGRNENIEFLPDIDTDASNESDDNDGSSDEELSDVSHVEI